MIAKLKLKARRTASRLVNKWALVQLDSAKRHLITEIKMRKLTYLSERKLASIVNSINEIETLKLEGAFIEAGCALGGSSILIAKTKSTQRPQLVYDVFGMIPPPTDEDSDDVHRRYQNILKGDSVGIEGDKYYGYENDLITIVQGNFERFGVDLEERSVRLIKGLVQDTLLVDGAVSFAHIDVDWYDPVMTCLERIYPKLVVGGCIILDDYMDWGGCRKATDEYLKKVAGTFRLDDRSGALKIIRTSK
ncbi:TylF/MycF/NovP-related O-methyltransferase [Cerasicoccus frondis]|uniref:TylF/MycF/NovP-related O-methyltransferase n=1 Tax=Cerasicoccus frondis TaxID=490090 RepID=UPI0028527C35|nr:TylF/MycF/NovP-related O-methyltransferase [Cerasicoccus frondis]